MQFAVKPALADPLIPQRAGTIRFREEETNGKAMEAKHERNAVGIAKALHISEGYHIAGVAIKGSAPTSLITVRRYE